MRQLPLDKTTLAVHHAGWLVRQKRRVIFIDADPQNSASAWLTELSPKIKSHAIDDPKALLQEVARLRTTVDDIVIDGPAGLSTTTRAIMLCADRVFLPCGPSILDLRAAVKALQLLLEAQKSRNGVPSGALIPNKLQRRSRLSREIVNAAEKLGLQVLPGLSLRQSFADAAGQAKLVWQMGPSARSAVIEMENLLEEISHE